MKIRSVAALVAALSGMAFAASAVPAVAATCTGSISGTVSDLVVPAGATCTANGVRVTGDVLVRRGATLASDDIRVHGDIVARRDSTVDLGAKRVRIGGSIESINGTRLVISGFDMSSVSNGTIVGGVTATNVKDVAIVGMTIRQDVVIHRGTDYGLELNDNRIWGGVEVAGATRTAMLPRPSVWSIRYNTTGETMTVDDNQVTVGTPPFVGGNVIGGDLVCGGNNLPPTNSEPGLTAPNIVAGIPYGQCATLI